MKRFRSSRASTIADFGLYSRRRFGYNLPQSTRLFLSEFVFWSRE